MNLTLDMICRAQHRLRGLVHRTPLIHSRTISEHVGAPTYLKLECLQKTGSFKPRGAFNRMLELSDHERKRGVVAVSGGNHAQGVAYAARQRYAFHSSRGRPTPGGGPTPSSYFPAGNSSFKVCRIASCRGISPC
jgi:hypothetical protein